MEKDAYISMDGLYRYWLKRQWDDTLPTLAFVMLNPSTADAEKDDPTIRSCIRLAKANGYGRLIVVNLFAWRATDPKDLRLAILCPMTDAVGPENDKVFLYLHNFLKDAVVAWGACPWAEARALTVVAQLRGRGAKLRCLGRNASGSPKHPLFIPAATPLREFV